MRLKAAIEQSRELQGTYLERHTGLRLRTVTRSRAARIAGAALGNRRTSITILPVKVGGS